MSQKRKVGIIICNRYSTCAGGKCFKSLKSREGAFERYKDEEVELVGFTSCGGCPGGNIEYAPEEMKKNGAEIIHLATGLIVGYPPCPRISQFKSTIEVKFGMEVVIGTHPIPEKYFLNHEKLKTWKGEKWQQFIAPTLCTKEMRETYN
ncbi:hypothetical protein NEF87_004706 [Candidatus Lokiarchaeum ossiferum]|uniref:CGGC domain-containing protein n=1 Tax=Candidatus Lokiarchaeum ossiferum TaxID=2951803 RepID=A0ABY6I0S5_9ARCH|nr:hypothetical protein NEF87_004706 [Candidatus Lokiarchaeum sp. B-35]